MAGRYDVLVVTAEEVEPEAAEQVAREVRSSSRMERPAVFLVSPALVESRLKHQLGDIDEAIPAARERLARSIQSLREVGLEADGEVGDSDPVQAISDELQKHDAHRILLISHARDEDSEYAEKDLLDRVNANLDLPAIELRVSSGHGPEDQRVEERRAAPGRASRAEEGRRISPNLPPVRGRDALGLLVGLLGTIALVLLAASCSEAEFESGRGGVGDEGFGTCDARLLLAGAAFLVNLGHVGGLLLMESVKYPGPFERLFARLSLFGTPIAVLISFLIGL
jgi:hypothetical protein